MKKIFLLIFILGQVIMAATVEHIEIKDTKIALIYEKDTRLPLVTMQLIFTNSGSIADGAKAGLAKLSSKILGEGTKKMGADAFADALEAKAIHISASTGTETFVIEMSCLKEYTKEAMKYLQELLEDPNLTKSVLEKVKTTTLGTLSRKENDFDYVAARELKAILFKGTPLAQPSAGTLESVASIDLDDVEKFLAKHIVRSNLIVAVGGDIDLKELKSDLAPTLEVLEKGQSEELAHYSVQQSGKEEIIKKDTQQAYLYFGSPYDLKYNDEEYFKARVATYILGAGGFGSRLMEEIRVKKGLAYSAYANINISKSSNYFSGYLQTKLDSLNEAKKSVQSVIEEFVKKGVSQEELDQTKQFLLGSEPLRVETMSQRLNRTFMEFYKYSDIGYTKHELEMIKNLKLDELNSFITKHKEILNLDFSIVTK